jgi:hypothetical protein
MCHYIARSTNGVLASTTRGSLGEGLRLSKSLAAQNPSNFRYLSAHLAAVSYLSLRNFRSTITPGPETMIEIENHEEMLSTLIAKMITLKKKTANNKDHHCS